MNRIIKTADLVETRRHMIRLEDAVTDPALTAWRQAEFLKEFMDGQWIGLWDCGPIRFETLKMYRKDDQWIIELEATEELT